ncbi:ATP-grasp domain-containing protein [Thiohalomonas denitrificans]|uniref:D-alanine-D-alanine ligase n=1 Tax=Thiohalomonas denitrificans TaxID=415747 RepID=A0A1G5PTE6_9GAMM|nr:ATP-grasp domain-containing protein [Thiohalomonas denitrificans]SCZ52844.1 D-alanine-D-alanine ligase [Thiohalomonas denitrificans]
MVKNIFIVGLDDFHRKLLKTIRNSEQYRFHGLLDYEQVVLPAHYPIDDMIAAGKEQLDRFDGRVDAIIGHWDFPTTTLLPVFREHCGLDGPSLGGVLIAEHKYWSRLRERQVVPDCTPRFEAVDPFADDAAERIGLEFPFWLKPVIAFSSVLAFYISSHADLEFALARTRERIGGFGEPFGRLLSMAHMPADIPVEIDGYHCIAEQPIGGEQCTAEGYIQKGVPHVYGIVDSFREPNLSSFSRYQLPSRLPQEVQRRIIDYTKRLVPNLDIDNTPFNVEYFWDTTTDRLWLLELNTRISKSHSPMFVDITGASNHEVAVEVALGIEPQYPRREGCCATAAKFMLRHFHDALVTRVPTERELEELEEAFPGTSIEIAVKQGTRLSEMPGQEPYSYEVAVVFMGAPDTRTLLQEYEQLKARLPLEFHDSVASA